MKVTADDRPTFPNTNPRTRKAKKRQAILVRFTKTSHQKKGFGKPCSQHQKEVKIHSCVVQRKRAGLITQRSLDRNES